MSPISLGVYGGARYEAPVYPEFVGAFAGTNPGTSVENIGNPYPERYVILALGEYRSNAGNAGVAINGTATIEAFTTPGALYHRHHHDVSYLAVPDGDTASFTIGGVNNRRGHIYTCPGPITHTNGVNSHGPGSTKSVSVTIPAGGFGIAVGTRDGTISTSVWTGVTGSSSEVSDSSSALVTSSGTVSVEFAGATTTGLSVAIFRPA